MLLFLAFLNQDILTHVLIYDQTPLFYIGLLGSLVAITRNMIPDEHVSFSPEIHALQVIENIQYCPSHWNNKLHLKTTFREFCILFPLKLEVLMHEIISLLCTPFILWKTFHDKSEEIIDFLKEIAIDHQELGIICKYGCFELNQENAKMEASMLNFKKDYPAWELDEEQLNDFVDDKVINILKESVRFEKPAVQIKVENRHNYTIKTPPMQAQQPRQLQIPKSNTSGNLAPVSPKSPSPMQKAVTDPLLINDQLDLPFAQLQSNKKPAARKEIQKPFNLSASERKK